MPTNNTRPLARGPRNPVARTAPPKGALGIKARNEARNAEIRKDFRASHGGLSARQWHMLNTDRRALYKRLATAHLRANYKFGWLKEFKYTGQELPADIEVDIWAQVDAKYPLPSRGA
jgi:hypothetical protein